MRLIKHQDITDSFSLLLPSGRHLVKSQIESFLKLTWFYNMDVPECNNVILEEELKMWHQRYGSETASRIPPKTAIYALSQCDKNFYPNIFIPLKIFATLPITISTSARSFPTLRRIKTYLWNTTGQDQMNVLALLNIHRETDFRPRQVFEELKKTVKIRPCDLNRQAMKHIYIYICCYNVM
jgi:hypothetical protein